MVRIVVVAALSVVLAASFFSSRAQTRILQGELVSVATPNFIAVGKRYAFTWAGGGPAQTYTIKQVRPDGWVLVEVADETVKTELFVPGEFPTRWLNAAAAISIQEMRPIP